MYLASPLSLLKEYPKSAFKYGLIFPSTGKLYLAVTYRGTDLKPGISYFSYPVPTAPPSPSNSPLFL